MRALDLMLGARCWRSRQGSLQAPVNRHRVTRSPLLGRGLSDPCRPGWDTFPISPSAGDPPPIVKFAKLQEFSSGAGPMLLSFLTLAGLAEGSLDGKAKPSLKGGRAAPELGKHGIRSAGSGGKSLIRCCRRGAQPTPEFRPGVPKFADPDPRKDGIRTFFSWIAPTIRGQKKRGAPKCSA